MIYAPEVGDKEKNLIDNSNVYQMDFSLGLIMKSNNSNKNAILGQQQIFARNF